MARHYMQKIFDEFGRRMSLPNTDIYDIKSGLFVDEFVNRVQRDLETLKKEIENKSTIYILENITERDNLQKVRSGNMCFIKDATLDPTVTSGAASYVCRVYSDIIVWDKVFEIESLDMNLTWSNIQDKPVSLVTEIDDAVTRSHIHDNSILIGNLSISESGNLVFNEKENKNNPSVTFKDPDFAILGTKFLIVSEMVE